MEMESDHDADLLYFAEDGTQATHNLTPGCREKLLQELEAQVKLNTTETRTSLCRIANSVCQVVLCTGETASAFHYGGGMFCANAHVLNKETFKGE